MRRNLNAEACQIAASANYITSRINNAACYVNDAKTEASFGRPRQAVKLLCWAAQAIAGANAMVCDLESKINQVRIDAEDAMLAAQSLEPDGDTL